MKLILNANFSHSDGELLEWHKLSPTQMKEVSPPTAWLSEDRDFPCLQHWIHTNVSRDVHSERSPLLDTGAVGRVMADLTRPQHTQTHTDATVRGTSASWISSAEQQRGRNLWSWHRLDTHCLDVFTHRVQADTITLFHGRLSSIGFCYRCPLWLQAFVLFVTDAPQHFKKSNSQINTLKFLDEPSKFLRYKHAAEHRRSGILFQTQTWCILS